LEPIDEVVFFYCKGPKTATGEDTAEIQGHGGPVIMKRLLEAVLQAGARPAEPGEFTYRAFTNGRIDLTQAEAVMGLIGARSERAARISLGQLSGNLGRNLLALFEEVSTVTAHVEAGLDFPDEDLPVEMAERLGLRLSEAQRRLEDLANSFTFGARLGDGARIAVVGPPNAGKSSLFNRLAAEDRAIVDDAPGTTRDVVEHAGEVAGIPVIYSDTAGLREADAKVERTGIERSMRCAESADILLLVLDGSLPVLDIDRLSSLIAASPSAAKLVVLNKKDLSSFRDELPTFLDCLPHVAVSAATGEGIEALLSSLEQLLCAEDRGETPVLTTSRQHRAVSDAAKHVDVAASMLIGNGDLELVAAELKWARESLAALLGKSADDEMLRLMFSAFCIGK
jgi:tRNA modification GTPase